jgi:myo-inositol-1(or 4)-monophosphatase
MAGMNQRERVLTVDWYGACERAAAQVTELLDRPQTAAERVAETGTTGEGGDRTLVLDAAAEDIVFAELEAIHRAGHDFLAVSEERGEVTFGVGSDIRVVIDPIDGSLNAKRGLPHHALSIAVADGPTMADVVFGYVHDFGPSESWSAWRGQGVRLDGEPMLERPVQRRSADGRLEVVAIESADPRWLMRSGDLGEVARRLRAVGAIAVSLCQLAAGRVDGMVSLWNCRAVDAAAAQLIVREAGGLVAFPAFDDPLGAPLDLEPHSPVVAALTEEALAQLSTVPAPMASRPPASRS